MGLRLTVAILVIGTAMAVFAACSGGGSAAEDARAESFALLSDGQSASWSYGTNSQGSMEPVIVWQGAEHCGWEGLLVLSLNPASEERRVQFVRAELEDDPFQTWVSGYVDIDAALPGDATDTGYSLGGARLFLAADLGEAWVVFDSHTERWPRQEPSLGCD